MNILLFTSTFFPTVGGAETVVHHLAAELHRRGHAVAVLAPWERGRDNSPPGEYPVRRYSRPSSKRFLVRQLLWPLWRERLARPFDMLHCHNAYPPGYVAASFKRMAPRVRVVITCHGTDIMAGERLRRDPRLDKRVRRAVAEADAVTAISDSMRAEILNAGTAADRVISIPNGVDVGEFRRPARFEHPRRYLFSMGGFRKRKGFDVLLDAFARIAADVPDVDLLLAGDGIERPALEARHRTLGLGDRVRFLGNRRGVEKAGLLRGCEFFVCPSRWEEPFGLVNVEAMAAGRVSVASAAGGIRDVVRDGETGLLVKPDDAVALAEAMLRLLRDPDRRRAMEARAAAAVEAYDWPRIVDRYEALYQRLREPAHA